MILLLELPLPPDPHLVPLLRRVKTYESEQRDHIPSDCDETA